MLFSNLAVWVTLRLGGGNLCVNWHWQDCHKKIAGLFLEAHPEPEKALCDGPCALRLNQLEAFLKQMKAIDDLVKTFEPLDTA